MRLFKKSSLLLLTSVAVLLPSCNSVITLTREAAIKWINDHQTQASIEKAITTFKFQWDFSGTEESSKDVALEKINMIIDNFSLGTRVEQQKATTLKGTLWINLEESKYKPLSPINEVDFVELYPETEFLPVIRFSINEGCLNVLQPGRLLSIDDDILVNYIDVYNSQCYCFGKRAEFEHQYFDKYCIDGWIFVKYATK